MSLEADDWGAPYFHRLAARHDLRGNQSHERAWARIVQIMAILTEKGRNEGKHSPHTSRTQESRRGLGTALCDGGDRSWPQPGKSPSPLFSEQRLARLLAAKGEMRATLMERTARMLAAKKPASTGIDCVGIADFLLRPDHPDPVRRIARDYYARLDRAQYSAATDTDAAPGDDA